MKRFIIILLSLTVLCSVIITGCAAKEAASEPQTNDTAAASEQYVRLLDNLENAENELSDCYGGAYINGDGNLVVCVTNDYDMNSNLVQKYTGNDDIIIKTVEYTYDELEQEQERIVEKYESMKDKYSDDADESTLSAAELAIKELYSSIGSMYVDEEKNTLVVEIRDLDDDKKATFKEKFSDKEFITFTEGYNTAATSAD